MLPVQRGVLKRTYVREGLGYVCWGVLEGSGGGTILVIRRLRGGWPESPGEEQVMTWEGEIWEIFLASVQRARS